MNGWTFFVSMMMLTSFAMVIIGAMAHDIAKRWLTEAAATRASIAQLEELLARQDQSELVLKQLAEDWRKKFVQLESDWKRLKEHADSQYAGAYSQLSAQQSKGFGR